MGQRRFARRAAAAASRVAVLLLLGGGCGRGPAAAVMPAAAEPRVASITPAGTDLVIGIGAAAHLVGVSNYDDTARPGLRNVPRVGDYAGIDWEKLAAAPPRLLIVQYGRDRIPADLESRCRQQGIELVNVKLDVLDDIWRESARLGAALHEDAAAASAVAAAKSRLNAVAAAARGKPRVRALLVHEAPTGDVAVVGRGTFLDELLTIAGGDNAAGDRAGYASLDREAVRAAASEAIVELLPGASPQVTAAASAFWAAMPDLPAVRDHRVYVVTDTFALQPGLHVGELAERLAADLHGDATTTTTNRAAGIGSLLSRYQSKGASGDPFSGRACSPFGWALLERRAGSLAKRENDNLSSVLFVRCGA